MTDKTLKGVLEEFLSGFAGKDEYGEWWGHDTNCGDGEETFSQAISQIKDLLKAKIEKEKLPVDRGNISKQQAYNQALTDMLKIVEEL